MGIYVRDANNSFAFYRACLAPLGIRMVQERFEGIWVNLGVDVAMRTMPARYLL